jgi:hypothetical protein
LPRASNRRRHHRSSADQIFRRPVSNVTKFPAPEIVA